MNAARENLADSVFMKACRREPVPFTPVWLMRQAGRYMKEYRDLREKVGFKELCSRPELAAEVTVHAARRLGVDAAIIFSDLLVVADPLGFPVTYAREGGPRIERPLAEPRDLKRVRDADPKEELPFVLDAIRVTRKELPAGLPLIGFAGAPFTLASYLIEGGGSKDFARTLEFMRGDPGAFSELLGKVARFVARFLNAQIEAGAQAVQVFDSWVGALSAEEYREHALPHSRAMIGEIRGAPVIHFGTKTAPLLEMMTRAGGDVIGIDWRIGLAEAWVRLPGRAVMGNMDPNLLLSSPAEIREGARKILAQAGGRPGHIFNLGHGVLPPTPVDNACALVDAVHEFSRA